MWRRYWASWAGKLLALSGVLLMLHGMGILQLRKPREGNIPERTMNADPAQTDRLYLALQHQETLLLDELSSHGIGKTEVHLFIRIFKAEQKLDLWIKNKNSKGWQFLKSYSFCQTSGALGPKRKEGDRQIPEGIYHIDRFNPKSKFHLSLGLNYPNAADRLLGNPEAPGSDIFIHGGCETVGCIPITDAGIEEVYILADWARDNGQAEIPVHIFPFRFTSENWKQYRIAFPQHLSLWQQLERIYSAFEKEKQLPEVIIQANGAYTIDL